MTKMQTAYEKLKAEKLDLVNKLESANRNIEELNTEIQAIDQMKINSQPVESTITKIIAASDTATPMNDIIYPTSFNSFQDDFLTSPLKVESLQQQDSTTQGGQGTAIAIPHSSIDLQEKGQAGLITNNQSMCSLLSMGSAEVEEGFLQVQGTMIDFASQMETLNRMTDRIEINPKPAPILSKAEREMRLITRNRKALDKRDEMIAHQNVDIESSFESNRLPEDKRSVERHQIKANLLESLDNRDYPDSKSELLMNSKFKIELPILNNCKADADQSENIMTSVQVTESVHDSIILLDAQDLHKQLSPRRQSNDLDTLAHIQNSTKIKHQDPASQFTFNSVGGARGGLHQDEDVADNGFMDFTSNHFISNYDDKVTPEPPMTTYFYSDRKDPPNSSSYHDNNSNRGTAYSESKSHGPIFSKAETSKPSSGAGSSTRKIKDMFAIISNKGSNNLHRSRGESETPNQQKGVSKAQLH